MTDKQIIIDGCDVSGCLYFCDGYCNDNNDGFKCNLNSEHCYYKQLKRKEQEFEEQLDQLKAENESWQKEYWKLEQGNDFLAEKNSKLKGCLTDIKEVAEICKCHNADGCYECEYFDDCEVEDEEIPTRDVCELILQKIKEVEE
jgi:hypothetical protein